MSLTPPSRWIDRGGAPHWADSLQSHALLVIQQLSWDVELSTEGQCLLHTETPFRNLT